MVVKICDRCGRTYPVEGDGIEMRVWPDKVVESDGFRFDLCPACGNELGAWVGRFAAKPQDTDEDRYARAKAWMEEQANQFHHSEEATEAEATADDLEEEGEDDVLPGDDL